MERDFEKNPLILFGSKEWIEINNKVLSDYVLKNATLLNGLLEIELSEVHDKANVKATKKLIDLAKVSIKTTELSITLRRRKSDT